jgi:L-aspartate oxidase
MQSRDAKVLILGSGIAGLSVALKFARSPDPIHVTLVAKQEMEEGATRYAQGGIASVWSKEDSFEDHVRDTLQAGAGLCQESAVRVCVEEGPTRVRELMELGVAFTKKHEESGDPTEAFDLHQEGGHGQRRILHADDLTGWEIERALLEQVRKEPRIRIREHTVAVDLITEGKILKRFRKAGRVLGAYVLDTVSGAVETVTADLTVLATGGAGKVYLYTSNPDTSTGDGIAMAYRAGAKVANLEFMQFHPTCLYHPTARTFLITEALRGEGAKLLNLSGEEFMLRYHPSGNLAPRDIVARAIDSEMKRTGEKHVWLDATHLGAHFVEKFPNISKICRQYGIDPSIEKIPVVPAVHYTCGGVVSDLQGKTSLEGLYAIGEVACTGVHGANRLASNSLLEAVVFAERVFQNGIQELRNSKTRVREQDIEVPDWETGLAVEIEEQIEIAAHWLEIRTLMWNYVGIVRSNRRLEKAKRRLDLLKQEIQAFYWKHLLTRDLIELRNLVLVAELIVECASRRHESRGLHYTVDYPESDPSWKRDTVLSL